jgi:hypothetical protein
LKLQYKKRTDTEDLVFPVVENSFHSGVVRVRARYAGYILAQEGEEITLPLSIALMTELAASPHGLRSHWCHYGDLHISNALTLGGVLK